MTVLTATGAESESELPYAALAELLHPLLWLLPEIPDAQAAALAGALAVGPQPVAEPFTVYAGAHSLLATAAERQPVLMLVDDAHWLDSASRDAIFFAVRRLHADSVAVLFAVRDDSEFDVKRLGVDELTLTGLGNQDGEEFVRASAAHPVPPAVARKLAAGTLGNPLAIVETLKVLTPAQLSGADDLDEPLLTGPRIVESFKQRVAGLGANARRALLVVAASQSGTINVVRRSCARLGLSLNDLDQAEALGFIANDAVRLRFSHPLIRSAVYHGASGPERREVHAALAAEMDEPHSVAERAWHLAAAVQGEDEEVASVIETAADNARSRAGHAAAAKLFEQAAKLSPDGEARARRLYQAGKEAYLGGNGTKAIGILDEALALADDTFLRADISLSRARVEMWVRSPAAARRILLAAAAEVEDVDPHRAALMLVDATTTAIQEADDELIAAGSAIDAAFRLSERAYRLGARAGGLAAAASAGIYGKMLVVRHRAQQGRALLLQSLESIDERESIWNAVQLIQFADMFTYFEEFDRARGPLERLVAASRRSSAPGALPYALGHLADLDFRMGRWVQAEAEAAEGVALAAELDHRISLIFTLGHLAWIQAARGQEPEFRTSVQRLLGVSEHMRKAAGMYAGRAGGLLALGLGRQDEAIGFLRPLVDGLHAAGLVVPGLLQETPDLIEAYVHSARLDDAETVLSSFDRAAAESPGSWPRAAAARCRGLLADDFESHFEEAMRLHQQTEMPFEAARTSLCFGERLRRAKRRLDAREQLHAALRTFEQLNAEPWANRTRNELVAAGESVRREAHAIDELTPQELQVALKVAEGATNKEVGAVLFMSPKTVEAHLSRVYSKLGLRSRTELAHQLRHEVIGEPSRAARELRQVGVHER
jgi:DNA-binding CsgD family transcriptional regulator